MIGQYLSNKNKSATLPETKIFLQLNKASIIYYWVFLCVYWGGILEFQDPADIVNVNSNILTFVPLSCHWL
jgi:hypothetical protein